jgi:RNA polymerase sigma-70 factor (ECF subfamily)
MESLDLRIAGISDAKPPTHSSIGRESPCVQWNDFDEIVKTNAAALLARAARLTRERSDAWDLLQDTFERALTHRPADLPPHKVRGWLFVIMQNLHVDRCRRATRHRRVDLTDEVLSVVPNEDRAQPPCWHSIDVTQVRQCLGKLDPRLREPYVLQTEYGLSLAAIAARLGVPKATAGSRVFRARRKLRALLEPVMSEENRF